MNDYLNDGGDDNIVFVTLNCRRRERKALQEIAEAQGLSMAEFIRTAINAFTQVEVFQWPLESRQERATRLKAKGPVK